jgi:hypothetical protein
VLEDEILMNEALLDLRKTGEKAADTVCECLRGSRPPLHASESVIFVEWREMQCNGRTRVSLDLLRTKKIPQQNKKKQKIRAIEKLSAGNATPRELISNRVPTT